MASIIDRINKYKTSGDYLSYEQRVAESNKTQKETISKNNINNPAPLAVSKASDFNQKDKIMMPIAKQTSFQTLDSLKQTQTNRFQEEVSKIKKSDITKISNTKGLLSSLFKIPENFKDGYQVGDISKTVASTGADLLTFAGKGILNLAEGIVDFGRYRVADVADLVGADKYASEVRERAKQNTADIITKPAENMYGKNSVADETIKTISQGVGYVVATIGAGALLGTASNIPVGKWVSATVGKALPKSISASLATYSLPTTSVLSAAGSATSEAYNNGASDGEAVIYGLSKGILEGAVEGIGGIKALKGTALGEGLTDSIKNKMTSKIASNLGKELVNMGVEFTSEGLEEVITSFIDPYLKRAIYDKTAQNASLDQLFNEFFVGGMVSAVLSTPSVLGSMSKNKSIIEKTNSTLLPLAKEESIKERVLLPTTKESDMGKQANLNESSIASPIAPVLDKNAQNGLKSEINSNSIVPINFEHQIKNAMENKTSKNKSFLGQVNESVASKIKNILGIDVSNKKHILLNEDIRHMINSHGNEKIESSKGQIAITVEDIKNIPNIINNPDNITKGTRNREGDSIQYIKKYNDNSTYVVEVVPENSDLKIKTMWKKPAIVTNALDQDPTLRYTSETEDSNISSTSVSNNSTNEQKSQIAPIANNINMQKSENNSIKLPVAKNELSIKENIYTSDPTKANSYNTSAELEVLKQKKEEIKKKEENIIKAKERSLKKIGNKEEYIYQQSEQLYNEIGLIRKGVKASKKLSSILDFSNDWQSIRTALANIKYSQNEMINKDSKVEKYIRDMLLKEYEKKYNESFKIEKSRLNIEQPENGVYDQFKARKKYKEEARIEIIENVGDSTITQNRDITALEKSVEMNQPIIEIAFGKNTKAANYLTQKLSTDMDIADVRVKEYANDLIKRLNNFNFNSKEWEAFFMNYEKKYNPKTDLLDNDILEFLQKNKIDTNKIEKADSVVKNILDKIYSDYNVMRRSLGLEELEYRKGYIPHEMEQDIFEKIGFKKYSNIPTTLLGQSEFLRPNQKFNQHTKKRAGEKTSFNFNEIVPNYISKMAYDIYMTPIIQNYRMAEEVIASQNDTTKSIFEKIDSIENDLKLTEIEKEQGIETLLKNYKPDGLSNFVAWLRLKGNYLAGKSTPFDRVIRDSPLNRIDKFARTIISKVSTNMVRWNPSSSATNFIPLLSTQHDIKAKAKGQAYSDLIRKNENYKYVLENSLYIKNRFNNVDTKITKSKFDKFGESLDAVISTPDKIATQLIVLSKYNQNRNDGMNKEAALSKADEWARIFQANRSTGNKSMLMSNNNFISKSVTMFQLEPINDLLNIKRKINDVKTGDLKLSRLVTGLILGDIEKYLFNKIFEYIFGYEPSLSILSTIESTSKIISSDKKNTEKLSDIFFGEVIEKIPVVNIVTGQILGKTASGRIPVLSLSKSIGEVFESIETIFNDEISNIEQKVAFQQLETSLLSSVGMVALPGGANAIKKIAKTFNTEVLNEGNVYSPSGKLKYKTEASETKNILNYLRGYISGGSADKNADNYYENIKVALGEKQKQELEDLKLPIADYWKYRKNLSQQKNVEDKFEYIANLPYSDGQKNIMINNSVNRSTKIDISNYKNYGSYAEFDYASKNNEKYKTIKQITSFDNFIKYQDEIDKIKNKLNVKYGTLSNKIKTISDYVNKLNLSTVQKAMLIKMNYSSFDQYDKQIINYINNKRLTVKEKTYILRTLGFTVRNGVVK